MSSSKGIDFLSSMTTKVTAILVIPFVLIIALVFYVVNLEDFDKVRTESDKLVIQNGESTIKLMSSNLSSAMRSASQLRDTSEIIPLEATAFNRTLDLVFNENSYTLLGSGGIWPDAYKLNPEIQSLPMIRLRESSNGQSSHRQAANYTKNNINGINLEYLGTPWFNLIKDIEPTSCIWDHVTLTLADTGFAMRCSLAIERDNEFWGAASVNFTLDSIQMAIDALKDKLGSGYAILIDNSNQIIASTSPKRLPYIDRTTGEMMLLSEFATIHPEWLPIERIVSQKREQTISRMVMQLPRKTINKLNDYDDWQESTQGSMLINAAASLKSNNPQLLMSHNAYISSHVLADEKLPNANAKAYIFEVPETLWTLVIIKPTNEINTIADNLGKSLIRYLIFALIVTAAIVFLFIDTLILRPLQKTTAQAATARQLLDKQQYDQLSTIKFEEGRRDEFGFINKQFNELLKHIEYTEAELDEANQQIHLGEEEYIARLRKRLEPKGLDSLPKKEAHMTKAKPTISNNTHINTTGKVKPFRRFQRWTKSLRQRLSKK